MTRSSSFYVAEALEYVRAWQQSTASSPAGLCGPIGPTEQLPLVAQIVNDLGISVREGHFWAMDEWFIGGKEAPITHPAELREGRHGAVLQADQPQDFTSRTRTCIS